MRWIALLILCSVALCSCDSEGACYSVPGPGQCRLWQNYEGSKLYDGVCCSHDCECWEAGYSEYDGDLTIYGDPEPGCHGVPGWLICNDACECEQTMLPDITTEFIDFFINTATNDVSSGINRHERVHAKALETSRA